jgi:hypothetical protein
VGRIGGGLDVDHVPGGIRRCFNPHHCGLAGDDGAAEACGIGSIKQVKADAPHGLLAQHPGFYAVIHDGGGGDALARFQGFDQRGSCAHARRKKTGFEALFQFAQQAFSMGYGRRAIARIDVIPNEIVIFFPCKRSGRLNGGNDCAGFLVDEVAGLNNRGADGWFRVRAVRHADRR